MILFNVDMVKFLNFVEYVEQDCKWRISKSPCTEVKSIRFRMMSSNFEELFERSLAMLTSVLIAS